jgi:hypothetical protein
VAKAYCRVMLLPGAERAFIHPSKLHGYLLSTDHKTGQTKARVFAALGYADVHWTVLRDALLRIALGEVERASLSEYGDRYSIRVRMDGPNGQSAIILTHWMVRRGENFPRFVTAYPGRKR